MCCTHRQCHDALLLPMHKTAVWTPRASLAAKHNSHQRCDVAVRLLHLVRLLSVMQALDGGYLALLVAEAVRGKKLPQGVEQGIMASGFLLITAVGLLLVFRDALNLALGSAPM